MLLRSFTSLLVVVLLVASCTTKEEKPSEITQEEVDKASQILDSKRNSGDTLVVSAEELQRILPKEVAGYTATGAPEVANEKAASDAWAIARQTYRKGQSTLTISVADYNGAYGMYAGATSVFADADTEEESSKVQSFKDGKVKGWESYRKRSHEASLMLAVANRYLITLEADNQENTELLNSVVDKIKLEELPGY